MNLFWNKNAGLHAVLDIGSSLIRVVIFEPAGKNTATTPRVVKKLAVSLPVGGNKLGSPREDKLRIVQKLHEVLMQMIKELGATPERIIVGVGPNLADFSVSEWSAPISGKRHLTMRDLSASFAALLEKERKPDRSLLAYPLGVIANGYPVSDVALAREPDTRMIATLGFPVLLAEFPTNVGEELGVIERTLGGLRIEFLPVLRAYEDMILRVLKIHDTLMIDIGSAHTLVMLMQNGTLTRTVTFPLGVSYFVERLVEASSISLAQAVEELRRYGDHAVDTATGVRLHNMMEREALNWRDELINALDAFYTAGPLPASVILAGGGAYFPEIHAILAAGEWLTGFSNEKKPVVRVVEGRTLFEGDSLHGALLGPEECALASYMIYLR
ncbi:MAG: hypothetical protein Q8Q94_03490 [bacterium]|nr:hypothetical protein [bacterium]